MSFLEKKETIEKRQKENKTMTTTAHICRATKKNNKKTTNENKPKQTKEK